MYEASAFPARDLAIFLAARDHCVMIAASLSLPYLLQGLKLPPEPSSKRGGSGGVAAAEAAIQAIERRSTTWRRPRRYRSLCRCWRADMELYRQRIDGLFEDRGGKGAGAANGRIERKLRLAGLGQRTKSIASRGPQALGRTARKLVRKSICERASEQMTKLSVLAGRHVPQHPPDRTRTAFISA